MLNMEDYGRPLMQIKGGKRNKKVVFVDADENKKIKNPFYKLELDDNEEFIPIPNDKTNREVLYAGGMSGSGKTYYVKTYVKELSKKYPKMPIYLISPFEEDESLDEIDPLRIKIDMDLVDEPIDPKDLKNSCIIFDDIDSIEMKSKKETKEIKEAIKILLHRCLKIGRHYNIHVLQTNHLLCDRDNTKDILNESHHITFFPHSGSKMSMKRLCEEYGGIDYDTLKKIKKMKTRWCTIHRNYPITVSTQKCMFIPSKEEDK